jgi:subtilisin family serine protease
MILLRAICLLLLLCAATASAQPERALSLQPSAALAQRQVLLMLKVAPAHYTPNAGYGTDYQAAPGRVARRHVAAALAHSHGLVLRDEWPMPALGVDCFVLDASDRETALREAQALAADPRVESAEAMQVFHVMAADDGNGSDPLFAAQPAAATWHLRELHRQATGKGVRVAVIDSGVALMHPDLRGQVLLAHNFVDSRGNVAEAHGTEVAGIIAAREGNGIGMAGIAPQARLLALRACWEEGAATAQCSSFTLAQALQFSIDARVQVINLSLTGPRDVLLSRLLDAALARGIDIVGAVDEHASDGGFPASHAGVLAGAALTGELPIAAVRAPGIGIPATRPDGGWGLVSGTSFAAAQVSGLVALLRQRRPGHAPGWLLTVLAPAKTVRSAEERPQALDACAVMMRTVGRCVCTCAAVAAAR